MELAAIALAAIGRAVLAGTVATALAGVGAPAGRVGVSAGAGFSRPGSVTSADERSDRHCAWAASVHRLAVLGAPVSEAEAGGGGRWYGGGGGRPVAAAEWSGGPALGESAALAKTESKLAMIAGLSRRFSFSRV